MVGPKLACCSTGNECYGQMLYLFDVSPGNRRHASSETETQGENPILNESRKITV